MRKYLLYSLIPVITFYSCDSIKNVEKKLPEKFKGKGMYVVEIKSAYLDEMDFGRSLLGNPLPITFSINENEVLVWEKSLGQKRGNVVINKTAILSYNPESIYRFTFAEEGIVSSARYYTKTYKKGIWAFDHGRVTLGKRGTSWFELNSYWVPSMPYKRNKKYKRDFRYD